jgi:hypothetical protein
MTGVSAPCRKARPLAAPAAILSRVDHGKLDSRSANFHHFIWSVLLCNNRINVIHAYTRERERKKRAYS